MTENAHRTELRTAGGPALRVREKRRRETGSISRTRYSPTYAVRQGTRAAVAAGKIPRSRRRASCRRLSGNTAPPPRVRGKSFRVVHFSGRKILSHAGVG